jgi:hypothetical protein
VLQCAVCILRLLECFPHWDGAGGGWRLRCFSTSKSLDAACWVAGGLFCWTRGGSGPEAARWRLERCQRLKYRISWNPLGRTSWRKPRGGQSARRRAGRFSSRWIFGQPACVRRDLIAAKAVEAGNSRPSSATSNRFSGSGQPTPTARHAARSPRLSSRHPIYSPRSCGSPAAVTRSYLGFFSRVACPAPR